MDAVLLGTISLAGVATAGLGCIEFEQRSRRIRHWRTAQLVFGRDTPAEDAVRVLDQVAGLSRGSVLAFDVEADAEGVNHYLSAERSTLLSLQSTLRGVLPQLRLEPVPTRSASEYRYGRSLRLSGRLRSLRDDDSAVAAAGLLAALQPLGASERVLLRWWVMPGRAMTAPHVQSGQTIEPEERRRLRIKNQGSVIRAHGVMAVKTGHAARGNQLLSRASTALRIRSTAYGRLRMLPRSGVVLRWLLSRRSIILSERYSTAEFAGLTAWPIGALRLPGVVTGTSPLLMPDRRIPTSGRVLGTATWPGLGRPIAQPLIGGLSHSLLAGPTGVGKSTLVTNLAVADMAAGRGLVLIDGKGDTAKAVLARVPANRRDDVIVLDCASRDAQPGLQLFSGSDPSLTADVVLGIFADLWQQSWGPLSERYLRAGLLAVAHDPKGTLADVPYVFSDVAYRRKLTAKLHDPLTKATLAAFEAMSPAERQQQLSAPLGKLGQLLSRPVVRTVLGQADPELDLRRVLRERRIVIVSLAPSKVGALAARLIGALTVFGLFQAVQARADLAEHQRTPFFVYLDEPKALGDLPMPLDSLLEQARGLGVGLTLAPQSMLQLPKTLREATLTNVATRVVFRQQADDARLLARDLRGVSQEDLEDLGAFEAVARIGLGPGDVAAPVTIRTAKASPTTGNPQLLIKASAHEHGVTLRAVDEALATRHARGATADEAAIGRRRRSS